MPREKEGGKGKEKKNLLAKRGKREGEREKPKGIFLIDQVIGCSGGYNSIKLILPRNTVRRSARGKERRGGRKKGKKRILGAGQRERGGGGKKGRHRPLQGRCPVSRHNFSPNISPWKCLYSELRGEKKEEGEGKYTKEKRGKKRGGGGAAVKTSAAILRYFFISSLLPPPRVHGRELGTEKKEGEKGEKRKKKKDTKGGKKRGGGGIERESIMVHSGRAHHMAYQRRGLSRSLIQSVPLRLNWLQLSSVSTRPEGKRKLGMKKRGNEA